MVFYLLFHLVLVVRAEYGHGGDVLPVHQLRVVVAVGSLAAAYLARLQMKKKNENALTSKVLIKIK